MNSSCATPQETGTALYEAGVILEIFDKLAKGANYEVGGGVPFTAVQFLVGLLDTRLDLIEEAARAKGAAA